MDDCPLCIISYTYNHGSYIRDTMEGFCLQHTEFPFAAIIVDDASTDNTSEVIKSYLNQNFLMTDSERWETEDAYFVVAQHRENQNCFFCVVLLKYNFYQVSKSKHPLMDIFLKEAKYVTFCEGDDYWIDPLKLQKQYQHLEANPDCGLVHTYAKAFVQSENTFRNELMGKDIIDEDEQFVYNSIRTLTVCMRLDLYLRYRNEIEPYAIANKWQMGDYPLFVFAMMNSKIYFLPYVTAVYRVVNESATHSSDPQKALNFVYSSLDCHVFMAKYYHKDYLINRIKIENLGYVLYIYRDFHLKPNMLMIIKRYGLSALYYWKTLMKVYFVR